MTSGRAAVDPNQTLKAFRAAVKEAERAAEGDSNDEEIKALTDVSELAQALDGWMSNGGYLPDAWERR